MLRATGVVRSSAPQIRQSWAGGMHASPVRSVFCCITSSDIPLFSVSRWAHESADWLLLCQRSFCRSNRDRCACPLRQLPLNAREMVRLRTLKALLSLGQGAHHDRLRRRMTSRWRSKLELTEHCACPPPTVMSRASAVALTAKKHPTTSAHLLRSSNSCLTLPYSENYPLCVGCIVCSINLCCRLTHTTCYGHSAVSPLTVHAYLWLSPLL